MLTRLRAGLPGLIVAVLMVSTAAVAATASAVAPTTGLHLRGVTAPVRHRPAHVPARAARVRGLRLEGERHLTSRLLELRFASTAVAGPVHVRVLLPTGYAGSHRRFPVIYLLHGSTGSASQWTTGGYDAVGLTRHVPAVVVMPDAGVGGEYTDWVGANSTGRQQWEDFHIRQLVPWIDQHFRTIARRRDRAITGESMGGLGTMEYAARHPDLFGTAVSLSGAVSLDSSVGHVAVVYNEALEGVAPGTIFGNPTTDELGYRGHSPVDLAENLGNTRTVLYAHDGLAGGRCDPGGHVDEIELAVAEMSQELDAALSAAHVVHRWQPLGDGTHTVGCFNQELALALPRIMASFRHPAPTPRRITYASIDPRYSQWGWSVAVHRSVREFSALIDAGRGSFSVAGSGSAVVSTPGTYTPHRRYRVRITRSLRGQPGAGHAEGVCLPQATGCVLEPVLPPQATTSPLRRGRTTTLVVRAGAHGALTVPVPLGPANTTQEYVAGSNRATTIYRSWVVVRPVPHRPHRSHRSRRP